MAIWWGHIFGNTHFYNTFMMCSLNLNGRSRNCVFHSFQKKILFQAYLTSLNLSAALSVYVLLPNLGFLRWCNRRSFFEASFLWLSILRLLIILAKFWRLQSPKETNGDMDLMIGKPLICSKSSLVVARPCLFSFWSGPFGGVSFLSWTKVPEWFGLANTIDRFWLYLSLW